MPVKIKSIGHGKFKVSTPNGVHAKSTSYANAKKQEAIINAADAGHPFTGKKGFGVGGKKKRK
jgi:hypothetical protein